MTEAMGHGVNQRKAIQMTPAEVEAFLAERRNMTMCSMSPDGSIHAVAMWYGFLDGCVTVETKAKSQKVQNLRRDPRLTLLFEDGDYYEELRGVELVGQAEIVDDPDKLWELGISVYERYNGPYTDELKPILEIMLHKRVAVKLNVERTVSWDHRKLGLPSTRPTHVKFAVRQAVAVPPARAMAAYGSPAFYEGRPPATTSRCARSCATRTRATGSSSRCASRSRARCRRPCGPWSTPRRCRGSPGPRSCSPRAAPAGSCCPTTIPTG